MNEEVQKFVLAVDAGEKVAARELLKKAMTKKVAEKLVAALREEEKRVK